MPARKSQLGIIHFAPLVAILFLLGALVVASTRPNTAQDTKRAVLSEGDDSSGSGSDSSGSGSSGSGSDSDDRDGSDSSGSGSSGSSDDRVETEVRYPSGVRVRTREEEDERRVDIYEGGRHLRIRTRGGVTTVTVENEEGDELETDELDEAEDVEVGSDAARIRIRSAAGRILLRQGLVSALTDFPVSVDQETGEMTITTPAGERVVAVLPEAAVNNMLATNVIDRVLSLFPPGASPTPLATGEEELGPTQAIEIDDEEGEIVYIIDGALEERFFGLFDVLVPKTVVVSAETGELLEIRQSILDRILDLFSF